MLRGGVSSPYHNIIQNENKDSNKMIESSRLDSINSNHKNTQNIESKDSINSTINNNILSNKLIESNPQDSINNNQNKGEILYSLVFNGEIYNFLELRNELISMGYIFHTDSDSEVILASFDAWGEACLNRFNGMWAFAIIDYRKNRIFLSRDRFGKKPLFYAFIPPQNASKNSDIKSNTFIFASEMKAIYPFLDSINPAKNFKNLAYKIFEYESTSECLIEGIERFPHAHFAYLNLDSIESTNDLKPQRYYHILDNLRQKIPSYKDAQEEFRALFLDAVKIRMRSDVRIGTALSGGVDSSATMCSMSYISKNHLESKRASKDWQHACVACFKDTKLDESEYAKAVCDYIGIKGEFLEINPLEFWDNIEKYFYMFEEVYMTSPVPMIATYGAIKKRGVSVTLDGHGADELFCGYGHVINAIWDCKFSPKMQKEVLQIYNDARFIPLSQKELKKEARTLLFRLFRRKIKGKMPMPNVGQNALHKGYKRLDYFSKWLYELFDVSVLPTLLRNYDRYSMINGVEIRMPFMDYRLVEFVFSLPFSYKIGTCKNGYAYTKRIIRDSMCDIMPDSVVWRKSKMGFSTPMIEWMQRDKNHNGLKEWFLDIAHSRDFLQCNLLKDSKKLQDSIIKICNGIESSYTAGDNIWIDLNPYLWQKSLKYAR
ncbi:asparagine synthase (glutamine-hydrolyzing) [Helicobacter saguini]|uniref:asparagine synthase (glutamine-hydrolyzing) n=1 Tax=Helicobacter saguini TaxID=1548018 RepID=UPI001EEE1D7A|nr:asparagine synthase (glutamine-hydrolyzing) [Helicobacter saguini]